MINSSNYSMFGMHSKAERYFWAAYHLFVLLSCLIGDTLILYASSQKGAFKVNKLIVTIIQHIAVTDLVTAIFSDVLSGAISLVTNSWVLGDTLCYVRVNIGYYIYPAGNYLIAVLTTSKFLLLKHTFRTRSWSKKRAHLVCGTIWACAAITPVLMVAIDSGDVHFDHTVFNCDYTFTASARRVMLPIIAFFVFILPNIIIIGTTIPTLRYIATARTSAKRIQGSVPHQGALTVVLTAGVFCISTLPSAIYYAGSAFAEGHPKGLFDLYFHRISYFVLKINVSSNFYIYTLTIKSFRRFLLSKFLSVIPVSSQSGDQGARPA